MTTISAEPPRISIIMPSFNQAAFLEEAIVSVVTQNYPNLEFIVLDGGSTDGSLPILKKHSAAFTYWRSRPDHGQLVSLMQGFEMATGELLGWVNSDDVLFPGALWALAAAHSHSPTAGLIGGNYVLVDRVGKIIRCKRHPARASLIRRLGVVAVNQPGSLFTRQAFDRVGGFDPRFDLIMDTDLYFRILASGCPYLHVDRWLSAFRIHSQARGSVQRRLVAALGRQARASWFSGKRNPEGRRATALVAYKLWQLTNGNYVRATFDTIGARGRRWEEWAAAHCPSGAG